MFSVLWIKNCFPSPDLMVSPGYLAFYFTLASRKVNLESVYNLWIGLREISAC